MATSESLPGSVNLPFIESLYAQYLRDPQSVDASWRRYFDSWSNGHGPAGRRIGPSFERRSIFNPAGGNGRHAGPSVGGATPEVAKTVALQHRVDQLIRNYRVRGHIMAQIDPLGMPRPQPAELDPGYYGFTDADMDRPFSTGMLEGGELRTLREILTLLRNTYCRSIGVQFMHIDDLSVREWLQRRMEGSQNRIELSRQQQLRILTRLTDAVIFEQFIQTKFIGAKSFSLEGGESLIPLLDLAFEKAGEQGMLEIVVGMAHRGRLNVLANIMGKSPQVIFREFQDTFPKPYEGSGDVKYHLGYGTEWKTRTGHAMHLSLSFNPSHLEFVNPVALGRMRAKQDRCGGATRGERGMVLLIHGDAAFAGEGIVQETLNLSQLGGYTVGGALHVVVNNQLGFTTTPVEGRSTTYATDVAKMLQSPIFHVNGEDPEAVAQVIDLAMDFRMEFRRDVVIDMYCYRRRGHNEGDEPSYTQPVLYRAIERRPPVREGYLDHLLKLGGVTREEADKIVQRRTEMLEQALSISKSERYVAPRRDPGIWRGYVGGPEPAEDPDTGVERTRLAALLEQMAQVPAGFQAHAKIQRLLALRQEMARGEKPLDWAAAELLAYASLVTERMRVRMSGQDCQRGTFSHRHAVLHDVETGATHMALQHLDPRQAPIEIVNSPLSEAGVLGFEYGYSLDCPDWLVIWEAQFGDFTNVAQVIIDQFLVSAEAKWRRLSGLVMLLPHGFEGQGPEHSSARLERFLELAVNDNIQVANPTTPGQFFHLLRRQALRRWRKPLVVMTPKSLLRHPQVTSTFEELDRGRFQRVLADAGGPKPEEVTRILLCSGKVYYELAKLRESLQRKNVAILRVEQLYPLPEKALGDALKPYREGTPVYWVQEEPENMGAWAFLRLQLGEKLLGRFPLDRVTRPASASPATGSSNSHKIEQEGLLVRALGGSDVAT